MNKKSEFNRGIKLAAIKVGLLLFICFAILAVVQSFSRNSAQLGDLQLNVFALFVTAGLSFLLFFFSVSCWQKLASSFGLSLSLWTSILQFGTAALAKYVPGKVWAIASKVLIAGSLGLPKKKMLTVALFEQMLTLSIGLLVGGAFLLLRESPGMLAITVFVGILALPFAIKLGLRFLYLLAGKFTFFSQRLPEEHVEHELNLLAAYQLVFYYSLLWCLTVAVSVSLLSICGVSLDPQIILQVGGATMVAVCVGFMALFSPGGLVVREGVIVAILTPVLGGLVALQYSIVLRVWNLLFDVFAAILSGIAAYLNRNNLKIPQ